FAVHGVFSRESKIMEHSAVKERITLHSQWFLYKIYIFLFKTFFFPLVSQLVIEEVNAIQENLEIERTCREGAEALASKLNRQNCSLKRKSMMLLSHLSPETITEINLEDEKDEEEEEESDELAKVCLSPQCPSIISGTRLKLNILEIAEKNQAMLDLEAARDQLKHTREELLKEKHDNTVLIAETLQQKKLLGKYNRVSHFAVEEFETLEDALSLEQDLRTEAEKFARAMLVEQKQLKRQSQILMQSSLPSQALQEALSQVTRLTKDLESQRLEHQDQIKQTEERLRSCEAQKDLTALRRKLELMEEEKMDYLDKFSKAAVEVKDLRFTVEELQKKLQAAINPPPAPAPPPPPPPPPPPAPAPPTSNPLSLLVTYLCLSCSVCLTLTGVDVRQQAVDEMMQRIKKGVQLRPVTHSPTRTRTRRQVKTCMVILTSFLFFNRTSHQPKTVAPATNDKNEELQRILLRRRDALES
uniref:Shootin-1 n=1 Tax=Labrus bergylta TaxID=56723 RepID=A0A3Q3GSX9_9LABR